MPFNVLLLPLLGGFLFLSYWNRTENFAKRLDKERLLLWSAISGSVLLGLSIVAYLLVPITPNWMGLHWLQKWWAYHIPFNYSGFALLAGVLGPFGAWFLNNVPPFKQLWDLAEEGKRAINDYGGPLEKLLYRAMKGEKYVMVTLRSGKVYIGRVAISLAPEDETAFYLLPIKSGYREGDKQRLVITTHYDDVYDRISQAEDQAEEMISDFGVVVPVREVVTASLYRRDIHEKYFPHSEEPIDPILLQPNLPEKL